MVAPARVPAARSGDRHDEHRMVNRSTDGKREQPAGPRGRESAAGRRERAARICQRLAEAFPGAACSLDFQSPFQLLVATILSAQCTDRRVNMVTGPLFRRWPSPARLAAAAPAALEEVVKSTGFFRAKAKSILGCCRALGERHGGEVPRTLEELVRLPGVGRKTANVVLGSAFGLAVGVVVDTHVGRISRRLGLTRHPDAVRAERDLVACLPRDHWIAFSHRLIELGRTVCTARRPRCGECPLADLCPRKGVSAAPAPR
jgi:endonuclease-3